MMYFVRLKATANGLALAGSTLGSLALPFLVEKIFTEFPSNFSFLLLGLVLAPTIPMALLLVRPASQHTKCNSPESNDTKQINLVDRASSIETAKNLANSYMTLICNPSFLLISFTHTVFIWSWATFFIVIVDFSMDLGNQRHESVALMSVFSATDLFGRLFFGFLADKKLISPSILTSIFSAAIGLIYIAFSQVQNYSILTILCGFLGLAVGGLILLFGVLFVEHLGLEKLSQAMGTSYFICGLTTLVRPLIIGYFRDSNESYAGLFIFLGCFDLTASLLWFVYIMRRRRVNCSITVRR